MDQGTFDLAGLIVAGGLTTYPLLVGSVVALGVVIDRLWALGGTERSIAGLGARLAAAHSPGAHGDALDRLTRVRGAAGLVLPPVALAGRRGAPPEEIARLVDARVFEALERMRRRLWLLATIGTIAPFVGLFGTVVGIMKSFHFMAESGSGGFAVVASGISEALVATALGLAVAVVAVAFYNYFEARLERIEGALRIQAAHLAEAAPAALAA